MLIQPSHESSWTEGGEEKKGRGGKRYRKNREKEGEGKDTERIGRRKEREKIQKE